MTSHLDTIRHHCRPLDPIPTSLTPASQVLESIQAVLFDVYGTLIISGSGDVGTSMGQQRAEAFGAALQAMQLPLALPEPQRLPDAANLLVEAIRRSHDHARADGVEYPEVDILAIWEETLEQLQAAGWLTGRLPPLDLAQLAVEYEVRTNPTWPMPGVRECLAELRGRGLRLGIVSNAQFFTPELFPALLNETLEQLGFAPEWQFYSYHCGWAKPGPQLYQLAAERADRAGIRASNVLYIGNDMLNDVAAARGVGFRTALFAGDARSLRLRSGDPRVAGVEPDLIVTELSQLTSCLA